MDAQLIGTFFFFLFCLLYSVFCILCFNFKHFRHLPYGPYDKYQGIPEHVRDKHRDKSPCSPVEASPEKPAGEGRKDENRVPGWKMDRCVKQGCKDESRPGAPSRSEAPLDKASPEDFLSEPDGEKEQKTHKGRGESSEVRVDRSDVPCTVRKESRKERGYHHQKL